MPSTLKQWAEGHEPAAISRIQKRLARFAGNTGDPSTAGAAQELAEMIETVLPKGSAE
jgi:hypothetical protein